MEEIHKGYNLRISKDGMAVLLDCDISTVEFDTLVEKLGKELEELSINVLPQTESNIYSQ